MGNESAGTSESSLFSREQKDLLQKFFGQYTGSSSNSSVIGAGTLAQRGNFLTALNVSKEKQSPWIVDSGASDHKTGDEKLFDTYSPCTNNSTVKIADGSLSRVAGSGSVVISPNLTLTSVLLVPKLDCNQLSGSTLTQDLN